MTAMRGRKSTEMEILDKALATVEDPYRIKDLLAVPLDELVKEVDRRIRYTSVEMVNQGRLFAAIKERVGHGKWEQFVIDQKWAPSYVRGCMRMLEVVAKFPQAIYLPPGRVTDRLLHLPAPQIDAVLADASEEAVRRLTPWDIEAAHQKIDAEAGKGNKTRKQYEVVAKPEPVDELVMTALGALNQIEVLDLKRTDKEKLRESLLQIEGAWNRASYNLRDPEHKTVPPWEMNPMADDVTE